MPTTTHRLLIRRTDLAPHARWDRGEDVLAIPPGRSWLSLPLADEPQLRTGRPDRRGSVLLLDADDRKLLACAGPAVPLRLNGEAAPPLIPLVLRDRLDLPGGPTLHVSRQADPETVPPPADSVGDLCAVCRTPFTDHTRVLRCSNCTTGLHLESDDVDAATRLECALLASSCPTCGQPISMKRGLTYVPAP